LAEAAILCESPTREVALMTRLFLALSLIILAAGPALAAEQAVDVGRIVIIDGNEGYVIAEFPNGQRLINVDRRTIWRYKIGDEIRVDSFGRPQYPA
jgi:hypothetical protein